jgi:hypothetical protein
MRDNLQETPVAPSGLPYELDVVRDGEGWCVRRRWKKGLRRYLPALWLPVTDEGLRRLTSGG